MSDEMRCDALIEATAKGDRRALSELFALEAGRRIAIARRGPAWLTIIVRNRALKMLRDGGRMELVGMDAIAEIGARNDDADDACRALAAQDELRRG